MNSNSKRAINQEKVGTALKKAAVDPQELERRLKEFEHSLKSSTWRDLEASGKFTKNDKISFISDDMLILGCDIGSEMHYLRAIDTRGRELSRDAFPFENNAEGVQRAKEWAVKLAVENNKQQIVLGLEPTGHYWLCVAQWMIDNGISVVQVNPYAVKQTKELEDNSQAKNDRKDPKVIANLVKDGNYGVPYLPEGIYADMREQMRFRDQLMEDRIRDINRMHRVLKIYFPEYMEAFGKVDGAFALAVLQVAPTPEEILKLGAEGIKKLWKEAKLRGRGYSRAEQIVEYAKNSIGLKQGTRSGVEEIQWYAQTIKEIDQKLNEVEEKLQQKCKEIPFAENIEAIEGIGSTILTGIIAEIGDFSRFDDAKEIQKLSGLGLVSCSSGKHQGETKISHRGRKRLRYWVFEAAKSVVAHSNEFQQLHTYYTTRANNPLKKMQSLIAIGCKILRVIFTILKTGRKYDPARMMKDIKRTELSAA